MCMATSAALWSATLCTKSLCKWCHCHVFFLLLLGSFCWVIFLSICLSVCRSSNTLLLCCCMHQRMAWSCDLLPCHQQDSMPSFQQPKMEQKSWIRTQSLQNVKNIRKEIGMGIPITIITILSYVSLHSKTQSRKRHQPQRSHWLVV